MARLSSAALLLLLLPGAVAAQVCAGYPMVTGSFAFSAAAARETHTDARDHAFSTRWRTRDWLALEATAGVSSLNGMNQYRAGTGVIFELPVKPLSVCAFGGLEHRFTWFDAETAAQLSGFTRFSSSEWYLPIGLAFGYNHTFSDELSIFAYTQPHYMVWRSVRGHPLAPLRSRPGESMMRGNFAVRSGVGVRAGQLLLGYENLFSSAPNGSSSGLRLTYLGSKAQTSK